LALKPPYSIIISFGAILSISTIARETQY